MIKNPCHIVVGTLPFCECSMNTRFAVIEPAKRLRLIPMCGHVRYRDAAMIVALLADAGITNATVVSGHCPISQR
jgi:hypothetical protein